MSYTPNPEFAKMMASDPETLAVCEQFANEALGEVQSFTPEFTGRLRRSWSVQRDEAGSRDAGGKYTRAGVYLMTTSSFWHLVEYGTVNDPPVAPVRMAVEASGCLWVDPGYTDEQA